MILFKKNVLNLFDYGVIFGGRVIIWRYLGIILLFGWVYVLDYNITFVWEI